MRFPKITPQQLKRLPRQPAPQDGVAHDRHRGDRYEQAVGDDQGRHLAVDIRERVVRGVVLHIGGASDPRSGAADRGDDREQHGRHHVLLDQLASRESKSVEGSDDRGLPPDALGD